MRINVDSSGLRQSQWYEYLIRFCFGGAITALAGIIAKRFGPGIGGLFLAFPAILSASATLIEKHEKQKKERAGKNGVVRAKLAAGIDAIGASMGAIGLAVFALIVWLKLPDSGTGLVLTIATLAWLITAVSIWKLREVMGRRLRKAGFLVSSVESDLLRRNR
ncbi:MAG TPA: DUF3147 family protein [Chthoniobacterales bacterium]|jgi:uncharacterized membrane protein YqjE|nr:DUF3147 family protein [Chthoniobacterales bacterium]